jgi:1-acyl-sn-glycerol-3-phosphate acyltransferase
MAEAEVADPTVRAAPVEVHPPTRFEVGVYRTIRGILYGLCRIYLRLKVTGREKLPEGPFIVAPVHRSNLDFLMAAFVVKGRMLYMGKASLWKVGWIGRIFNLLGAFPVHRGTADRAAMRTCLQVIENGEPVVMFPEGTRREGPTVEEVFDGPAYVAARAGVPVVPVGIGGSERAMPIGARMIRPRRVAVVVGDPIEAPATGDSGRVPRRQVREMTTRLQAEVQRLYDEAQRRAG